jgi:hypothetical protein
MKNIIIPILLIVLNFNLKGQNFEGSITWSVTMEITDTELKKKLESSNQQLAEPANQAKLKELQKQLNDPQTKALLDQNPQMKDLIEKQLAALGNSSSAGAINSLTPKSIEIKLKNGNSLVNTIGGIYESEILYLKGTDRTYIIDKKNKTYSPHENKPSSEQAHFTVTKTDEIITILNYKSRKYIVDANEKGQKLQYFVWTTLDIKDLDGKQFSRIRIGQSTNSSFISKVEGVPLKIQVSTKEGKVVLQVINIKKEVLPNDLFMIPAGFTEKMGGYGY